METICKIIQQIAAQQNYTQTSQQQEKISKLEDTLNQSMQLSIENLKNIFASIKNLEAQVGQIDKRLVDHRGETFRTNTQTNPKEYYKAITTRRGRVSANNSDKETKRFVVEPK